jgi:hypothetical protein
VPLLDEFLVTMQNVLNTPDVHAALSANPTDAPLQSAAPPGQSTAAPEPAAARLHRPSSAAGAQLQVQWLQCAWGPHPGVACYNDGASGEKVSQMTTLEKHRMAVLT